MLFTTALILYIINVLSVTIESRVYVAKLCAWIR